MSKFTTETFKDILNYEGKYQISNFGNVKSLERKVKCSGGGTRTAKKIILKPHLGKNGYLLVNLSKQNKLKTFQVHQLVAIAFLNHNPCKHKLVVNHIDFNKTNNHVNNLEIITNRENSNQKHLKSTSKYVGVSWHKPSNKWRARIKVKGKSKYLGCFIQEKGAHKTYQEELIKINKNEQKN